jgi:hypothetical protein
MTVEGAQRRVTEAEARCVREGDPLRRTMRRAMAAGDRARAAEARTALGDLWRTRGALREGLREEEQAATPAMRLHAATGAYFARFAATVPALIHVTPDDYAALVEAIHRAVKRGRRLSEREVLRVAGVTAPEEPDGPGRAPA